MSILIAEPRADKNGKMVTRHVRNEVVASSNMGFVPAPTLTAPEESPEMVEIDDLNVMESLGIYDTNSSACERVESYLADEYGASFEYDEKEGTETIIFESSDDSDRFTADLYSGELRAELKEIAEY